LARGRERAMLQRTKRTRMSYRARRPRGGEGCMNSSRLDKKTFPVRGVGGKNRQKRGLRVLNPGREEGQICIPEPKRKTQSRLPIIYGNERNLIQRGI